MQTHKFDGLRKQCLLLKITKFVGWGIITNIGYKYNCISMKIKYLVIFFILFSTKAFPVKFYSTNSIFGISLRATNSICKDNNGFIWASSKIGILRLTDNTYHVYQLPYEAAGAIIVKLVYEQAKLIAYTNNGQVFLYNAISDRFELLINLNKALNNKYFEVNNVAAGADGTFWLGLSTGLYKFKAGKLSLVDDSFTDMYAMTWFNAEQLFFAKSNGILLLNAKTLKKEYLLHNVNTKPFFVSSVFIDKIQDKVWLGTLSQGLFSFSLTKRTLVQVLKNTIPLQPVFAIREYTDSTILIGFDGQGVWELEKAGNKVLNIYKEDAKDPYSLRGNGVYDIFCDKGKRVWVGSIGGGVSFFEIASPFVNQITNQLTDNNSLINNNVNYILEASDGKIWFATDNGISCWNPTSNRWQSFYGNKLAQSQVFISLNEDKKGRIWAACYSSGLYVLDGKTGKELAHFSRAQNSKYSVSNFVFDLFRDSQGNIWIGSNKDEFVCFDPNNDKFKSYTNAPVSRFAEPSPGKILLGCSYGIVLVDTQTGKLRNLVEGVVVQDMLILDNVLWIASNGDGLLQYNLKTGSQKKYTTKDGLPSNFTNSIAYADNYFWIGTENGLCRFCPKSKAILTFSSILPLSGFSFNKSSICRLKNGHLACGTNNGAVIFNPASLGEHTSKGKIYFQNLTIAGRSIRDISSLKLTVPVDSLEEVKLQFNQNTINLELLPIGATSVGLFSWKLEGFDKKWSSPVSNSIITYTNLPSRKYILKIKLYNSSFTEVIAERSLILDIVPPFWKTAWFWAIIFVISIGIIVLSFLYYLNRLKQQHSEEKIRFFTKTAHDIRNSLTLIKAPIEDLSHESNLSGTGRYCLQLAIDQARKLSSVVTQLLDFQKIDIGKEILSLSMADLVALFMNRKSMFETIAINKDIRLDFSPNCPVYFTAVDEPKIEKVFDNLVSNAIKYSQPGGCVQIQLSADTEKWVLKVADKGIGISKKAQRQLFNEFYRGENAVNSKIIGSGIGLLLVKNYVKLHNGKISFESEENVGSSFFVEIPFKKVENWLKEAAPLAEQEHLPESSSDSAFTVDEAVEPNYTKEFKVLLVEDNDDLLNFMRNSLGREFEICTATDGEIAWETVLKQMPDLVVSDVMMPNKDGFELCEQMKSTFETSHIPIILLTGLSEKTEQLHGLGLGADDYLVKPFDMSLLSQRIKTIIRNRQIVREKIFKVIKSDPASQLLGNELNDKFLKKILEVVKTNISNTEFNKDDFAVAMNISSSLLYKKIKSLTNQSPSDFIKIVRLDYSLELLQTRKYSVNEISSLCGFINTAHFCTVFKKHYGKTPMQYFKEI
jgi:signal transduction histidine kinase/DNA-binding response OmpR family regulator/ligand-binding sensor domain-containing protein